MKASGIRDFQRPAWKSSTHFHPASSTLAWGYLPAEHQGDKPSFREAAAEALKRYADRTKLKRRIISIGGCKIKYEVVLFSGGA